VELMLENYHRTLLLTSQQIAILRTRVQSAQEVFAINVDLYRNRVVRVPHLAPQLDHRALFGIMIRGFPVRMDLHVTQLLSLGLEMRS
jgi:hypothetical protein